MNRAWIGHVDRMTRKLPAIKARVFPRGMFGGWWCEIILSVGQRVSLTEVLRHRKEVVMKKAWFDIGVHQNSRRSD
jgi:hypothetical protein